MSEFDSYSKMNEQAVKLIKAAIQYATGNVLFSPLNLMTTLALAAVGARGETSRELAGALGVPTVKMDRFVREILDELANENGRTLLTYFAALFDENMEVTYEYAHSLEKCFDSRVGRADFSNGEDVAEKINSEIDKNTCGMLRNVVSPADISGDLQMVLLGTLYFCSRWEYPFDKSDTEDMDFYLSNDEKKQVPMMYQRESFPYFNSEGDGVHGVILPCRKSDCEIVALMPIDPVEPVSRLVEKLNHSSLERWIKSADADEDVAVYLPRFALTHRLDDATKILKRMGVATVFTDAADLSGICGSTPLKLDRIVHAVCMEIDENGARAAAATVMCHVAGAPPIIRKHREFKANRPFVVLIRHKTTELLLFAALVKDPDPGRPWCKRMIGN